ncbi:MAG: hypothetical protein AVDCRST_MAG77-233 [uncultured Chloroflexi bacterium]|uniref:Glycosyltransferase RgtA/B/C/D-like domain-containing protein n=1 Tax=uncultured Chloroflexota bacterium TaxID=166587 RepID=A0A6J4H8M3_9CHLR|nr:MAG: hypothetical protein AVDCRST_MAG77-233 [uncultured Chloroflexota bacterium]
MVGLPFIFDDAFDLPRAEGQSAVSLLRGIDLYVYYRPLPLLLWKALREVQGRYDPVTLHALSLALHALAGWLVVLLLRRVAGPWALVPALFFLVFPYSYQAVTSISSVFHLLVTVWLLLTLLLYAEGRLGRRHDLLGASVVTGALACWTHELGVLVVPLVLMAEGLLWLLHRDAVARPVRWPLLHAVAAAVYLAMWSVAARRPEPRVPPADDLAEKGLFFLQGLAFPATAQLVPLQERFGHRLGSDFSERTLLAGGVAGLVALGAYAVAGRHRLAALLALAWCALSVVQAWWLLDWAYVIDAPRLTYLASAGAAVFWGLLPSLRFRVPALTWTWRAATGAALGLVLWQSGGFVQARVAMLEAGAPVVWGIAAAGAAHPGQSLVFVDVPSWFVGHRKEYARGHLGVTLIPMYLGLDRLIYTHTGVRVRADSLRDRPATTGYHYEWDVHGRAGPPAEHVAILAAAGAVYDVDLSGAAPVVRRRS